MDHQLCQATSLARRMNRILWLDVHRTIREGLNTMPLSPMADVRCEFSQGSKISIGSLTNAM